MATTNNWFMTQYNSGSFDDDFLDTITTTNTNTTGTTTGTTTRINEDFFSQIVSYTPVSPRPNTYSFTADLNDQRRVTVAYDPPYRTAAAYWNGGGVYTTSADQRITPKNSVKIRYDIIEEINRQLAYQNRRLIDDIEYLQIDTQLNNALSQNYSTRFGNVTFSFMVNRTDTRSKAARAYGHFRDVIYVKYDIDTTTVHLYPKNEEDTLTRDYLTKSVGERIRQVVREWSYKKFITTEFIPGEKEGLLKVYDKPVLWIKNDTTKTLAKFTLPEGLDKVQMNLVRYRLRQLGLRVRSSGRHELLIIDDIKYKLEIGTVFNLATRTNVQVSESVEIAFAPTQIPLNLPKPYL